jgi:hypothetical protein
MFRHSCISVHAGSVIAPVIHAIHPPCKAVGVRILAAILGFVLPVGAVVATAVNSSRPALRLSAANPAVQSASVSRLGKGFLFPVLVVAAVIAEQIDRRFGSAAAIVHSARWWRGDTINS